MFNKKPAVKEWSHQACFSSKYKQVDVSYHRLNCKPTKCKFKSKKKLSKVKKKQNFKSKKKQNYLTKSLKKLTYKFLGNQQNLFFAKKGLWNGQRNHCRCKGIKNLQIVYKNTNTKYWAH